MTQKHTPGPWGGNGGPMVYTRGANFIGMVHYDDEVAKANTRLIAAAPELLEALEAVMALEDNTSPFGGELQQDRIERTIEAARAAIAKAKGETTR